tara:strand:- start:422 stop:964 length:543 start_codon:yes stop_codon:yes gene_type:complete
MDINSILTIIESNKGRSILPNNPGVYLIFAKKEINFNFKKIKQGELLYVGKSEKSLSDRKAKQHFSSKRTGSSTVRRSLGAIFKTKFNLKCFLRGKGNSDNDSKCYIFNIEGEEKLTKWMDENLLMSFIKTMETKNTEHLLIEKFNPPLNIMKATHQYVEILKKLRAICKIEAEKNGVLS